MDSPSQPPPPGPDDAIGAARAGQVETSPRGVLARILLALVVATALSSGELVEVAEAQPFGSRRSVLVDIAVAIDGNARGLGLDRPNGLLRSVLGRTPRQDRPSNDNRSELAAASDLIAASRLPLWDRDIAGDDPAAGSPSADDEVGPLGPPLPEPPVGAPPAGRTDPAGPTTVRPEGVQPETVQSETVKSEVEASTNTSSGVAPEPETGRVVNEASKLRLWAGGDSLGEYVGNQLLHPIADPALVEVTLDYHISTGLTRPDYFDWPSRFQEVMNSASPPEVLVFMVGGNDNQNMLVDGDVVETETPAWYREYERRVLTITDQTTGSHLYWIGLPPMRDTTRNEIALEVNQLLSRVADERPNVTFIDLETQFGGPAGSYSAHIVDPDGQLRLARAADGVHITATGSTWVADDLWSLVEQRWSFQPISEVEPDQPLPGQPL